VGRPAWHPINGVWDGEGVLLVAVWLGDTVDGHDLERVGVGVGVDVERMIFAGRAPVRPVHAPHMNLDVIPLTKQPMRCG
jgi:hypothetical protein